MIRGKPIKTIVTLQMSRSSLDLFHLQIEDGKSHTLIAEISLNSEQFADFLSTRQAHECEATIDMWRIKYEHRKCKSTRILV